MLSAIAKATCDKRRAVTVPLNNYLLASEPGVEPEMALDLEEAIRRLPPRQRLVLRGRLAGKSPASIAAELRTTATSIYTLRKRALAKLREEMGVV